MNKFYLSLNCSLSEKIKSTKYKYSIDSFNFSRKFDNNLIKKSPIYSIVELEEGFQPLENGTGTILFLYIENPFQAVGCLNNYIDLKKRVFISHGLASIVIFLEKEDEKKRVLSLLNSYVFFFEEWNTENFEITDFHYPQNITDSNLESLSLFKIDYHTVDVEIQDILNKLFSSLKFSYQKSLHYYKPYKKMICWFNKSSHLSLLKYCYLKNLYKEEEYLKIIKKIFPNAPKNEIEEDFDDINNIKKIDSLRITRIHQIKDDLIQISAIARTFANQAFSGNSPIINSNYSEEEYSLLGIGGVICSLFNLYNQTREIFKDFADIRGLIHKFKSLKSPDLPNYFEDLSNWAELLNSNEGIESLLPEISPNNVSFHYVYLSSRLGFRETKHSLSAASQTISLVALPPWNLCTFFHEFSHAHIRALFSFLYPSECHKNKEQFDKIYNIYSERKSSRCTDNFYDFFQFLFMSTVSDLYELDNKTQLVAKKLPKKELIKALKKKHHQLNELLVHILDFNYFYDADIDSYIKSIWSSWLELPFILTRVDEYLLRSVCAISSIIDGDEETVFSNAIKKIENIFFQLEKSKFANTEPIKYIVERLQNIRDIKLSFFQLFPFIKASSKLLISSSIKEKIVDPCASLQDDDTYSMELNPNQFKERRIESPINFLFDYYKKIYREEINISRTENNEFTALWIFFALRSNYNGEV